MYALKISVMKSSALYNFSPAAVLMDTISTTCSRWLVMLASLQKPLFAHLKPLNGSEQEFSFLHLCAVTAFSSVIFFKSWLCISLTLSISRGVQHSHFCSSRFSLSCRSCHLGVAMQHINAFPPPSIANVYKVL